MTREQAEQRAAELNREQPGRRWVARRAGEQWEVAGMNLPPSLRIDPLKGAVESRPQPPHPADPRTPYEQTVGGLYGTG